MTKKSTPARVGLSLPLQKAPCTHSPFFIPDIHGPGHPRKIIFHAYEAICSINNF